MKSPNDFLDKFKRIESSLKRISRLSGDNVRFKELVSTSARINPVVQHKSNELWSLYGLRNVFAHGDRDQYIAEIKQIAFDQLDLILKLIDNPPVIGNIFSKSVFTASSNEITEVVLRAMQQKLYTHVPIYDDNKFIGLLTETTLLDWLVENINEGRAQFYKRRICDINLSYLNSKANRFLFAPAGTSIFDVYQKFLNAIDGNARLGAILITENGKRDERLLGIITAWDLPKIQGYLE